jgi:hypothetical protein
MLRRVDAGQSTLYRRTPGSRLSRWIIEKRAGKGQDAQPTHLPGLCPDLRTATSPMWKRNIPVVADAIWRIRDRLTNVATRLSAFSSDKAPPGWLVARSVSSGSKHLVAATKTADDRDRARKSGECRFRGLAGERRRNM